MKVIIDCDPGVDDAFALTLASVIDGIEILAITIVHGNTNIECCATNAKLIVNKVFPSNVNPNIYIGAANPILQKMYHDQHYYGKDGLAGTTSNLYKDEVEKIKKTFLKETLEENQTHAALKILELVNKYPNEVTIIAIGPLTNLALAYKMTNDPEKFTKNIKHLYIMGGNEPDKFCDLKVFDHDTNYPEFNFAMDAIATKIVIDHFKCPIRIFTFDACLRTFRYETKSMIALFEKYIGKSKRCKFIERIGIIHRLSLPWKDYYISCDLAAMIGVFYVERCNVVYKRLDNYTIEVNSGTLSGIFKKLEPNENISNQDQDVQLCLSFDPHKAFEIFEECLIKLTKLDEYEG